MKAALNVLHHIHSTHDYGISFTSDDIAPMHSYIHFPIPTNAEAYDDAHCWGSQLSSSDANGTLLPLFKLQSINGGIISKIADPLAGLVNGKNALP
jgi:hypothetical protein